MGAPRFLEFENFRAEVVFNLDRGTMFRISDKIDLTRVVHTAQECASPQNALT